MDVYVGGLLELPEMDTRGGGSSKVGETFAAVILRVNYWELDIDLPWLYFGRELTFCSGPEIGHFWGLGGPGGFGDPPERWGGFAPNLF